MYHQFYGIFQWPDENIRERSEEDIYDSEGDDEETRYRDRDDIPRYILEAESIECRDGNWEGRESCDRRREDGRYY